MKYKVLRNFNFANGKHFEVDDEIEAKDLGIDDKKFEKRIISTLIKDNAVQVIS